VSRVDMSCLNSIFYVAWKIKKFSEYMFT
jgi:hypothetical protein